MMCHRENKNHCVFLALNEPFISTQGAGSQVQKPRMDKSKQKMQKSNINIGLSCLMNLSLKLELKEIVNVFVFLNKLLIGNNDKTLRCFPIWLETWTRQQHTHQLRMKA